VQSVQGCAQVLDESALTDVMVLMACKFQLRQTKEGHKCMPDTHPSVLVGVCSPASACMRLVQVRCAAVASAAKGTRQSICSGVRLYVALLLTGILAGHCVDSLSEIGSR
jgi:hypothetical protein